MTGLRAKSSNNVQLNALKVVQQKNITLILISSQG